MNYTIFLLFFLSWHCGLAQVLFNEQNTYKPGEAIRVTVLSDNETIGIYNDIRQASEEVPAGDIVLGTPSVGYYQIDFILSSDEIYTYFIWVLPEGGSVSTPATIDPSTAIEDGVFTKMYDYFTQPGNSSKVLKATVDSYLATNAVSAGFTVTMCLSSFAAPTLVAICGPGLVEETTAFSTTYFKQLILAMKQENIIDQTTYEQYDKNASRLSKIVIAGTDLYLGSISSAVTTGSSLILNELINDDKIRLLVSSQEQVARKAISVISVVK